MKTVFSLFFIFISFELFSCELSEDVISLSGPVTLVLEELDLIRDSHLLAISKFHPVSDKKDKEILAGGLFLSKKILKKYKNKKIFFDKSRELNQLLEKSYSGRKIEINTSKKNPFEAVEIVLKAITSSLKNCDKELRNLRQNVAKIKREFKLPVDFKKSVFFLGKITSKLPELIFSHDGFILSLKELNDFQTYPSELAYTTWSMRILKKLKNFNYIGIEEGQNNSIHLTKEGLNRYNISMRGVLTPGIRQVYFLKEISNLKGI